MKGKEWLNDIKVGDKVICQNPWVTQVREIDKANKAELWSEGDRFSRRTGNKLNDLCYQERMIAIATPEDEKKLEILGVINRIALLKTNGLSVDELTRILKIFEESEG